MANKNVAKKPVARRNRKNISADGYVYNELNTDYRRDKQNLYYETYAYRGIADFV